MSAKHFAAMALAILIQPSTAAAGTTDCSAMSSHAESRTCIEGKAKRSAADLKKTEVDLATAIEQWDEEGYWKRKSVVALKESGRKFELQRKSQCDFEASLAAGGNGAGDMRLECEVEMNQVRIARLRELMRGLKR